MRVVHLLSCGGTIEKIYLEHSGAVANLDAKIERYLKQLRLPDTEVTSERLMNKDSLEMGDEDRRVVLEAVERKLSESAAPIIITHGTDTLVETGMFLKRNLRNLPVPIIFTGAMTPLGFEGTDALQNLTESLLASQLLEPGIYLVMHNQVFPIDGVRKDRSLARFVPV
jgi:L-asparaginase